MLYSAVYFFAVFVLSAYSFSPFQSRKAKNEMEKRQENLLKVTRFSNANSNKNELAHSRDFVRILFRSSVDSICSWFVFFVLLNIFFGFWTKVKVKFYFSTFAYMPNEYCTLVHSYVLAVGCSRDEYTIEFGWEQHAKLWPCICVLAFQLFRFFRRGQI